MNEEKNDAPWTPAIGDQVVLVIGGPTMVVTYRDTPNSTVCTWFVGAEMRREPFPTIALRPV